MIIKIILVFQMISFSRGAVSDIVTGTWNMQGSTSGSTEFSLYTCAITNLMKEGGFDDRPSTRHPVSVLMLQEAGLPPNENDFTVLEEPYLQRTAPDATNRVRFYAQSARNDEDRGNRGFHFLYYVEVARRVSEAIVSRVAADNVILFPQFEFGENSRPALGIRIGNTYFFTLHTESRNDGNDRNRNGAVDTIIGIETYIINNVLPNSPDATWIIMGDFNRTPGNMRGYLPEGRFETGISRHYAYAQNTRGTGQPTQQAGLALDFAIVGGGRTANRNALETIHATKFLGSNKCRYGGLSDHAPLRFRVNGLLN